MPQLYMIGGANGAGKTTSAMDLLPELLRCSEYVNADSIAAALSPFAPETTALKAGRLMLERIYELADQKRNFSFETTMASRTFEPFLLDCKKQGYKVGLLFFWLQNPKMAIERVKDRVEQGGHDIPSDVILRRYKRGIINFFELYSPLADEWYWYDNSHREPVVIGQKTSEGLNIYDEETWNRIKQF